MVDAVLIIDFDSPLVDYLIHNLESSEEFTKDKMAKKIIMIDGVVKDYEQTHKIVKPSKFHPFKYYVYYKRLNEYLCDGYNFGGNSIAHIHFLNFKYIFLFPYLKKCYKQIVLSFWGSDLFLQSAFKLKLLKPLFRRAKYITMQTNEMQEVFHRKVGTQFDSKVRKLKFGLSSLPIIDQMAEADLDAFRKKYGIAKNRKCVVIGYNRLIAQRHDRVIQSFIDYQVDSSKIKIIIPWTYGSSDEAYRERLEDLLRDKFDYTFIDQFLDDKTNACLRMVTDIMIQVRDTDAFSASLQETLYSKNQVITGSWLPYQEMTRKGITMKLVDAPEESGKALNELLNEPIEKDLLVKNKQIIWDISSWEVNIKKWLELYN